MVLQKQSVFIVDDDPDDRESIRDAFLDNNHQNDYSFFINGDQLIGHFADNVVASLPSLILLDLNMPGKDGREVLKELKKSETLKPIPVVVLTTSSAYKDREVAYQLGANCFLTKPNSYKELMILTDCLAKLWLMPQLA